MPIQRSQGKPRPLVPRIDELPVGCPAPPRPAAERDADGKLLPGPGTSALARSAALAKHEAREIERLLGLWVAPEDHAFAPYARLAREWRDQHTAQLAATVGGGRVGAGPASVVASAALQLAASRWLFDRGAQAGDAKALLEASRLADASRANVLSAHELAAKEAEAHHDAPGDPTRSLLTSLGVANGTGAPHTRTASPLGSVKSGAVPSEAPGGVES
jgi:hypothetical protein